LQKGRALRGCIQGDSLPDRFIPRLIELYLSGKLPVERLVTYYEFGDIHQAVTDSVTGRTIKPILCMP
jgi:aryl-alcohol dehydrogenase